MSPRSGPIACHEALPPALVCVMPTKLVTPLAVLGAATVSCQTATTFSCEGTNRRRIEAILLLGWLVLSTTKLRLRSNALSMVSALCRTNMYWYGVVAVLSRCAYRLATYMRPL